MASQMLVRALYQRGSSLLAVNNAILTKTITIAIMRSPLFLPHNRFLSDKQDLQDQLEDSHEEETEFLGWECSPNWEIFYPTENRFCLPNKVGLAYADFTSLLTLPAAMPDLIDLYGTKDESFLKIQIMPCPKLLEYHVTDWFPALKKYIVKDLNIITLQYFGNDGKGEQKFVNAAVELVVRLCCQSYWADFINPFSGKPLVSYRDVSDFDLEDAAPSSDVNDSVVFHSDRQLGCVFRANIYTNADWELIVSNIATE